MSIIIWNRIGFSLRCSLIGPENSRLRCKTVTNHDLVICVFPRFWQFHLVLVEFSLVVKGYLHFFFSIACSIAWLLWRLLNCALCYIVNAIGEKRAKRLIRFLFGCLFAQYCTSVTSV